MQLFASVSKPSQFHTAVSLEINARMSSVLQKKTYELIRTLLNSILLTVLQHIVSENNISLK